MSYDTIYNDIKFISNDFLKNYQINVEISLNISDMVEYISDILLNIYDKDIIKKYLYPEILEQILSYRFKYLNENFKFNDSYKKKYFKRRLKILLNKPKVAQKSDLWHLQRKDSIGASELSSVFNKNPFCTYNKYLLKKSGYVTEADKNNNISIHCIHGIKYEEIAQKIYCLRSKQEIYEFGSIEHEKYSWLRASPDGITKTGIMLEIKVPLKRKIYGIPPIYYWYQMQHQLQVCKLNKCDFLECKIEEYNSWNEFLEDKHKNNNNRTIENLEKGIIIEYIDNNEIDPSKKRSWIYPKHIDMSIEDIYKWISDTKYELSNDNSREFSRIIPWKLVEYSCFRVYKNNEWWKNNFNLIENFWNLVIYYRKNGIKELIKKNKKKKNINSENYKKKNIDTYTFLSDSDN